MIQLVRSAVSLTFETRETQSQARVSKCKETFTSLRIGRPLARCGGANKPGQGV